jgi:DNA-binding PadR family transcriptional regulator
MNKITYLGELEQMVLLAVLRLKDDAYGMSIQDELEATANRTVTHGALYITLERLIKKGCLTTRMGAPTRERGGRAKRYVRVTATGRAALRASGRALRDLWNDHLSLLEEE